jgi:hypothetical protein
MIPGVLSAGQLGVVDENVLIINRTPPITSSLSPAITTPSVVIPVINTPGVNSSQVATAAPGSTSTGSRQFSPFVGQIAGGASGNPATPSSVIASIKGMDSVQKGQALAYIDKIIDNPAVPQSDKATFVSIRSEVTGEQQTR